MRRREFIAFIGAGVMLPFSARAQQSTMVYRIARLHPLWPVAELTERSQQSVLARAFPGNSPARLRRRKNLVIERYSGEGRAEIYSKLARDVATSNPNVVFAVTVWMVAPQRGNFHHTDSCDDQRSGQFWLCAEHVTAGREHHGRQHRCRIGDLGQTA